MKIWQLLGLLAGGYKALADYAKTHPLVWVPTLDGQPVELIDLALKIDKPQSRWLVRWRGADGLLHEIVALHDWDGQPLDVLALDGVELQAADMDIIFHVRIWQLSKSESALQWEWTDDAGDHRLKLTTNLLDNPLIGEQIRELVE
ncbi:MAG: hypothetical protein ACYC6A_00875 [Armatimonadota bacterium]